MKTKIFADFQICISVPLSNLFHDIWEDFFCKLKLLLAANRLIYLNNPDPSSVIVFLHKITTSGVTHDIYFMKREHDKVIL